MDAQLKEILKVKLVEVTCTIDQKKLDKKALVASYTELLKGLEKRQRVISKAIQDENEEHLLSHFGEDYAEYLGIS